MQKRLILYLALALIGASSVTSQILLLRELITTFYGNELIYGLVLMLWLLFYALGSAALGRTADRIKGKQNFYVATQILVMALVPCQVFLSRIIKLFWGIPQGALLDPATIFYMAILILSPLALLLGFQFALGSRLLTEEVEGSSREIGYAYMWEALGWVIFGGLLSFIFLYFLNAFQIAAILVLLLSVSAAWLLKRPVALFIVLLAALITWSSPVLESTSARMSFKDFKLLTQTDSPYGRIQVIQDQNDISFYQNGGLLFSTADKLAAEEIAHLSLLQIEKPKKVLLIGGGLGGALIELLKYNGIAIDYVELDPKIIELGKTYLPENIPASVQVFPQDGISFIKRSRDKYDLILINLPDPDTALLNRFYTRECFLIFKSRLKAGGVLALKLNTSESYLGSELKILNASVYKTLFGVFPYVSVLPGNYNYFYASASPLVMRRDTLLERWGARKIRTQYFRGDSLYFLLEPQRLHFILSSIQPDNHTRTNLELFPISYFYATLLWVSYFSAPLKNLFYSILKLDWPAVLWGLLALLLMFKLLSLRFSSLRLPLVLALLSFAGMSVSVLSIFTFQMLHGYVYLAVGLIITAYMGGLALGSYLINSNYSRIKRPELILRWAILLLLLFLLIFSGSLRFFNLPLATFLAALPLGAVFPLAVKLYEKEGKEPGALAGILYGADLLGGAAAAFTISIFFIPVFGILNTLGLIILMCLGALLLL
jgi:spermidine synthase